MHTSNFETYYLLEDILKDYGLSISNRVVGISGWCAVRYEPSKQDGEKFNGRHYKKLAPKKWFYDKYVSDGDQVFYTRRYYEEVLSKLDAKEVFEQLGENAIILCWEQPGEFCHRRIVAEWFEKLMGVEVPELDIETFLKREFNLTINNLSSKIKELKKSIDIRYPKYEKKEINDGFLLK